MARDGQRIVAIGASAGGGTPLVPARVLVAPPVPLDAGASGENVAS